MKSFFTRVKKIVAPEFYVEDQVFSGVPTPTSVLAGMIAQHLLMPETEIKPRFEREGFEVKVEGRYHIVWQKYVNQNDLSVKITRENWRVQSSSARRQVFYDRFNDMEGKPRHYWGDSDVNSNSRLREGLIKYLNSREGVETGLAGFSVLSPALSFSDNDKKCIQQAVVTLISLDKERKKVQKEAEKQQQAVDLIENWLNLDKPKEEKSVSESKTTSVDAPTPNRTGSDGRGGAKKAHSLRVRDAEEAPSISTDWLEVSSQS